MSNEGRAPVLYGISIIVDYGVVSRMRSAVLDKPVGTNERYRAYTLGLHWLSCTHSALCWDAMQNDVQFFLSYCETIAAYRLYLHGLWDGLDAAEAT